MEWSNPTPPKDRTDVPDSLHPHMPLNMGELSYPAFSSYHQEEIYQTPFVFGQQMKMRTSTRQPLPYLHWTSLPTPPTSPADTIRKVDPATTNTPLCLSAAFSQKMVSSNEPELFPSNGLLFHGYESTSLPQSLLCLGEPTQPESFCEKASSRFFDGSMLMLGPDLSTSSDRDASFAMDNLHYPTASWATSDAFDEMNRETLFNSHYSASLTPEMPLTTSQVTTPSSNSPKTYSDDDLSNLGDEDTVTDEPYARLIHKALMGAPDRRMSLQELYDWFKQNTNKTEGSTSNGWQNSIRHNLSMNEAFRGERDRSSQSRGRSKRAGNIWSLTDKAIRDGVKPTTRYRRESGKKRSCEPKIPQPNRQLSGAKGGRAARRSARRRSTVPGSPTQHKDHDITSNSSSGEHDASLESGSGLTEPLIGDGVLSGCKRDLDAYTALFDDYPSFWKGSPSQGVFDDFAKIKDEPPVEMEATAAPYYGDGYFAQAV